MAPLRPDCGRRNCWTLWTAAVGIGPIRGAKLVVRAGVVVVPADPYTYGVDAATGQVLWATASAGDPAYVDATGTAQPGSLVYTRIDADDQTAYIPAWGASVSALDLRTGAVRWVWRPGRAASDTGAAGPFRSGSMGARVSGDTVFATAWHDRDRLGAQSEPWLLALDRRTGPELWRVTVPVASCSIGRRAARCARCHSRTRTTPSSRRRPRSATAASSSRSVMARGASTSRDRHRRSISHA